MEPALDRPLSALTAAPQAPAESFPTVVAPDIAPTPLPAIPESRRLTLEWPPRVRVGDSDVVRLTLEMDERGLLTPTAEIAGNIIQSELVAVPNLYATHDVIAEGRLDITGLEIIPEGTISQSLLPGEAVTFLWSVKPEDVGNFRGTVWLFLRFIPKDGQPASARAISAQVIEIQAVNLFGLGGTTARLLGAAGTVIGSLLGVEDLISWFIRRRRSRR